MYKTFQFILLIFLFIACGYNQSQHLTIATAANVQFAMQEMVTEFENETGVKCNLIVGSSGKLTAQIMEGAPYHVFVSADMKYPQELFNLGQTMAAPKVYASGKLVLWTTITSTIPSLDSLSKASVHHIAIANPKTAPYGAAAIEILKNAGLYESVKKKLVYGESIAQVNQFVESGTADFGFTAKSVVLSSKMKGNGIWSELPDSLYRPIEQGVVVLRSEKTTQAQLFYDFLFSEKGKAILKKYGYGSG